MTARVARWTASLALVSVCLAVPGSAGAHWCDDNWGSAYNLVVKPETDTITVPGSINVYVQNNIGEALPNFSMNASGPSGCTINVGAATAAKPGYLLPGEKLRHTLTFSGSNCGTNISGVVFTINFGEGVQDSIYGRPTQGEDVVIRRVAGDTLPATKTGINTGNFQARHLQRAARADYGSATERQSGLDGLLSLYCAGRRSWDGSGNAYTSGACESATYVPTACPTRSVGTSASKYDYQQLWAAQELGARRSVLDANRLTALRARLKCGYSYALGTTADPFTSGNIDSIATFRDLALFVLGYLGNETGARDFLLNVVARGPTTEDQTVAKAALLVQGDATYHDDVVAGAASSNFHVSAACAAALGITDGDDTVVRTQLFPKADFIEPDTSDAGKGYFAAQLLALVAWHRRGYQPDAGDTGDVSFYGAVAPDTTDPASPGGVTCTATAGGTIRVQWNQVTRDVNNGNENVTEYRVYSGNSARTAGCTDPGCATDYDHYDAVNGSTFRRDFTSLDGQQTYYFAVIARDAAGNLSQYSSEVSCTPIYAPTAVISCTPTSGDAPLAVSCNSSGSSDANGASDIASRTFSLDGQTPQAGATVDYNFDVAANHVVLLRVTDQGGLFDTDQVTITVTAAGNTAPTAVAGATPTTGQAPLQVAFSSAGSTDPDTGQPLSYSWSFQDGNTSTEQNPTHTFDTAGSYDVLLTVTDDAPTPASGYAIVTIDVLGNSPPDVSAASADPLFGPVPLTVHFDASGVVDPDGNNVSVEWDFGDGSAVSSETAVDHVYASEGVVTARLTATDDYSQPASATRSFVINVGGTGPVLNQAPDCTAATVTPSQGPLPLTLTLDATGCTDAEGNGMTFLWRIPTSMTTDDTVDTATAEYTVTDDNFLQDGELTIQLQVQDDAAQPMSTSREFVVTIGAGGGGGRWTSCICSAGGGASRAPLGLFALLSAAVAFGLGRRRR